MVDVPGRRCSVILAFVVVLIVAAAAGPAAAFPGASAFLAVTPVRGNGVLLVSSDANHVQRRICPASGVCKVEGAARFSPDGRSLIVRTRLGLRLIDLAGGCVNCEFGAPSSPAFAPDGTEITLITDGRLVEDGIDGIRRAILGGGAGSPMLCGPRPAGSRSSKTAACGSAGPARCGRSDLAVTRRGLLTATG